MATDACKTMQAYTKVVELKSFALAADTLGMSHGMASRHVAALEDRLGVRLINRTTRKFSVTDAGTTYDNKAMQILAMVADAEQTATSETARPRGTLRISCSVAFGGTQLGQAIAAYTRQFPEVKVDMVLCERNVDLVEEGFDLALRVAIDLDPGLIARRLTPIRFVACAAPDYLSRHGTPLEPAELSQHECLVFSQADWRQTGGSGAMASRQGSVSTAAFTPTMALSCAKLPPQVPASSTNQAFSLSNTCAPGGW